MVTEGLYEAGHAKGHRSYGGVWGGQYASYHHNLIAHQNSRAVRFNGSRAHDTLAIIDYSNNLIYNWGNANACYGGEVNIVGGVSQVNMVNNYYKPGPATPVDLKFIHASYTEKVAKGVGEWYLNGNIMEGNRILTKHNYQGLDVSELGNHAALQANKPIQIGEPIALQSAKQAYQDVLKFAGAILPSRDEVDKRLVIETSNGTATGMGVFGKLGIIDSPNAVGGWSNYNSIKAPIDSDADGMPDEWEIKHHLDPNNPTDRNLTDKNGYTNLEIYLNEKAIIK
jgi:hypothetical protein